MKATISGPVRTWRLGKNERRYVEVNLSFEMASQLFSPFRYNALTGQGEQRDISAKHSRDLQRDIQGGNYTPTSGAVGLRKDHREKAVYEGGNFFLEVDSDNPLPLLDHGHTMDAIASIAKEARAGLEAATTEKEKGPFQATLDEVMALPIGFTIHLGGDTQSDFINLQAGKTVDRSHLFSLKVQKKVLDSPELKLALDIAKLLHRQEKTPFSKNVRFDSRGSNALPVTTLCAKGASDLSTSLVGLARVGLSAEPPVSAKALADCVSLAYRHLEAKAPQLLADGMVLAPIFDGGTRGSATVMVGLAILLAHRMIENGLDSPESLLDEMVECAEATLNVSLRGGFSVQEKRRLMNELARDWYHRDATTKHQGLPISLLNTLSPSAYGVSAPPKPPKAEAAPIEEEQDEALELRRQEIAAMRMNKRKKEGSAPLEDESALLEAPV